MLFELNYLPKEISPAIIVMIRGGLRGDVRGVRPSPLKFEQLFHEWLTRDL